MALNIDLYNSTQDLEKGLSSLKVELNRTKDIEDITNFVNETSAHGIKALRLKKYVYTLKQFSKWVDMPLRNCRKTELMQLVRKIDAMQNYNDWTKHDKKIILKRFYKWINGDEEPPQYIKWLKSRPPKNKILPEELLTEEEVVKLIDVSNYIRDKAFISALYESSCRVGRKNYLISRFM